MADNVAITAGVGTGIKTDQDSGDSSHMQIMKLAISANGDGTLIPATAANGILVDVSRVTGPVAVTDNSGSLTVDDGSGSITVDDGAASLTVDAPVGTPVFVRLSDGSAAITALPVTDNGGNLSIDDGGNSITIDGTVAATQSGTWNVGTVTTITNVVHVDDNSGTISIDDGAGSITVDGTVTVTQGTAAASSGGWPVKITDGTDTVGISTVSATKALKVDVVQTVGDFSKVDVATFTDSTSKVGVVGAIFNTLATDLSAGQAGALRCTAKRTLMVSLTDQATQLPIGTGSIPIRTDPTNTTATTIQDGGGSVTVDAPVATPVFVRLSDGTAAITALPITDNSGSITIDGSVGQSGSWVFDLTKIAGTNVVAASAGIIKVGVVDGSGAAWSATNPLPVANDNVSRTRFTNSNSVAASETAIAIWAPNSAKKFCITSLTLTSSVGGLITIYDGTNSATNWVYKGTVPVGIFQLSFTHPWLSATADNVLRYTTDTGITAQLQVHGFEV